MKFAEYLKIQAAEELISRIDDHALFYLSAIFGEYLMVETTEGCHQPTHDKHTGPRVKAQPYSRGVICIECHASLMKKNSGESR